MRIRPPVAGEWRLASESCGHYTPPGAGLDYRRDAESGANLDGTLAKGRVAFQGEPGAFSEAAAVQLLGDAITTVPCSTFDAAFRAIPEGRGTRRQRSNKARW